MKNKTMIHLRAFHVRVWDHSRNSEERDEVVVLDKTQLQAAQLVGQSSKELIHRLCERAQLSVMEIGRTEKISVALDLEQLYRAQSQTGKREAGNDARKEMHQAVGMDSAELICQRYKE